MRRCTVFLSTIVAGVYLACTEAAAPPEPSTAASVQAVAGQDQEGTAGAALAESLAVRVLDQRGSPMAGATVQFAITAGGGTLSPASRTTGNDGGAKAHWTLGPVWGPVSATAAVEGLESVGFTASAKAAVSPEGATITTANGSVTLTVPAGALAEPITLAVASVTAPLADPGLVAGTAYEFGPAGTAFNPAAQLRISYDPAGLPSGTAEGELAVHRVTDGAWVELAGTVDAGANTVTTSISTFSVYGVLRRRGVSSVAVSPNTVTLAVGGVSTLSATAKDASGNVLQDRPFTWTSSNEAVATVDGEGMVTAKAAGTATVTATSGGVSGTAQVTVALRRLAVSTGEEAETGQGERIWVINEDGSQPVQLTSGTSEDSDEEPAWSPDGTRIAFKSDRAGTGDEIFVMNTDGTGITQLTSGPDDPGTGAGSEYGQPAWSPDGTRIAHRCVDYGPSGYTEAICIMNADGSNLMRLSPTNDPYGLWVLTEADGHIMCRPTLPGLPVATDCEETYTVTAPEQRTSDVIAGCSLIFKAGAELGLNNPRDGRYYTQAGYIMDCYEVNGRHGNVGDYLLYGNFRIEGDCNCSADEVTFQVNTPTDSVNSAVYVSMTVGDASRRGDVLDVTFNFHVLVIGLANTGARWVVFQGILSVPAVLMRVTDDAVEPAWSPDGARIAFARRVTVGHDAGGPIYDEDIFTVKPDRTDLRRVTTGLFCQGPAWSPDGSKIACAANNTVVVVNAADGSGGVTLATGTDIDVIDWSPDGALIAFDDAVDSDPDGRKAIYVMNADGRNRRPITEPLQNFCCARWKP